MPPNGTGIAALEMLNIMENFPLGRKDYGFGSPKALHTMIEARKSAYADMARYIGDPRPEFAGARAALKRVGNAKRKAD